MNPFTWDPTTGQYRYPNGRFVPRSVVRAAIDTALDREKRLANQLSLQLRNGEITLQFWRQSMRDAIKNIHLYSAAIAKGGWAQLTQADFGRVGKIVRSEYGYLERLATGIANGTIPLDGRFKDRSSQYAEAGRDTYHEVERAVMRSAGYTLESNVLHPAEHCTGANSCVGETARGRVRIGQLIPIGRRQCLRKCRCSLAYWKS